MTKEKNLPLVSVIILNWNGLDNTKQCLESISKQSYKNIEVVIVDNGSIDGSKDYFKTLTSIVYVDNVKNRGFTGGHIDGLKHSSGSLIMLLNNDAVVDPHYITKAVKHFAKDSAIAAVGGRAYFWNKDQAPYDTTNQYYSYQTINIFSAEAISNQSDKGYPQEINNVSGSAVIVRRSVVDDIGYLYQPFFAYYEETDLFARIKRAGYKVIYDPELAIWHQDGSSSSSHFQYFQLFRNRFIFAVRNFETYYLLRFLKSYVKTGILVSLYQFKHNEYQTLHKAFSRAFWYNFFRWPNAFLSRHALRKQLGKSNYNHKIAAEQNGISFVVDVGSISNVSHLESQWKHINSILPLCELIIVVSSASSSQKIQSLSNSFPNVKIVSDKGYFEGHSLNIGWLSSTYELVYFGSLDHIPSANIMLTAIAELSTKGKVLAVWGTKTEIKNNFYNSDLDNVLILTRKLLSKCGGLDKNLSLSEAQRKIILYAQLRYGKKGILALKTASINNVMPKVKAAYNFSLATSNQVKRDRITDKPRTTWMRLLDKYYRLYQIRNVAKWFFSFKIPLRLKLARLKNLLVSTFTFNRSALALELKHMKNEVIKLTFYGLGAEDKEKFIRQKINLLLKSSAYTDIPVFIICRDRLEPLIQLVNWLERAGFKKIIFIDNDSIYPPLVKYLKTTSHQVIFTGHNTGHTVLWTDGFIKTLCPDDFYIVNDPDVIPTESCPTDHVAYFLQLHEKYIEYQKVGFGLKIDDLPDYFTLKNSVIDWESQFWKHSLEEDVYEAGIDTTFAVYKPFTFTYILHPSIRTGGQYVARHLPWYNDSKKLSGEEVFYRDRVNQRITSWNVDELPERYKKEMKLQS